MLDKKAGFGVFWFADMYASESGATVAMTGDSGEPGNALKEIRLEKGADGESTSKGQTLGTK